jgi:hypothetical protein
MTLTTAPATTSPLPSPRPAAEPAGAGAPDPRRAHLADWLQPRPMTTSRTGDQLYAMPTGWHADRIVAAICRPGHPDGEVATGPYRPPRHR